MIRKICQNYQRIIASRVSSALNIILIVKPMKNTRYGSKIFVACFNVTKLKLLGIIQIKLTEPTVYSTAAALT